MVLLFTMPVVRAQQETETIKKSLKVENNNKEFWFCLCNINGDVDVESYEGNTIEVELKKHVYARNADEVKKGMQELQLHVEEDGEYAKVIMVSPDQLLEEKDDPLDCSWNWNRNRNGNRSYRGPKYRYRFDYQIKVPKGISVKVSTVNNGDVLVKGVGGNLYAGNVNGDVTVEGANGDTKATTVNGVIEVDFTQMPNEFAHFETVNGDILVTVPARADGIYNFETQWGKVYSDLDFDSKIAPRLEKTSGNRGGTMFKFKGSNGYQVGKGGPTLEFETLNGSIKIKKK